MKKIETLTEEQKAKFPEYVNKWISIGLSTENPSKEVAQNSIIKVYESAGVPAPKTFIWVESPLHAGVCYALLKDNKLASVGASLRASVWDSVGDSVADSKVCCLFFHS